MHRRATQRTSLLSGLQGTLLSDTHSLWAQDAASELHQEAVHTPAQYIQALHLHDMART